VNVDRILEVFNRHRVGYLVIGGVNFLLRHAPVLTFDVDLWIEDGDVNRRRCEQALAELGAEWGSTEANWRPVSRRAAGWLTGQDMFCLTSPAGPAAIFRSVKGLDNWPSASERAVAGETGAGIPYRGISDEDMLRCQLALDPAEQRADRIRALQDILGGKTDGRA
jgi:hypothetical protein